MCPVTSGRRGRPHAKTSGREHLQALTRGIEVLAVMNRLGVCTNGVLARRLGLAHSTAHRILMVLTDLGYLRHDPLGHQFVLAGAVRELSAGYRDVPLIDEIALPRMRAWTRQHGLPLLLVTEADGELTIRASTDAHWPVAGERHVAGSVLPAAGSSEAAIFRAFSRGVAKGARGVERLGYTRRTLAQEREIHISVPVISPDGLIACLSIRCSLALMKPRGSVRRWATALRALAAEIVAASL